MPIAARTRKMFRRVEDNAAGASPFFLTCDHAGRRIPRVLGDLGLEQSELQRHIAWDIGVAGVMSHLASRLDAIGLRSVFAPRRRLQPSARISDPDRTAQRAHRGTRQREPVARCNGAQRVDEIFVPYHARIEAELDSRRTARPADHARHRAQFHAGLSRVARPWHVGMLYHRDTRLAAAAGADCATKAS